MSDWAISDTIVSSRSLGTKFCSLARHWRCWHPLTGGIPLWMQRIVRPNHISLKSMLVVVYLLHTSSLSSPHCYFLSLSITTYRNAEALQQKDKNHPFQLFKKIRDLNAERTGWKYARITNFRKFLCYFRKMCCLLFLVIYSFLRRGQVKGWSCCRHEGITRVSGLWVVLYSMERRGSLRVVLKIRKIMGRTVQYY